MISTIVSALLPTVVTLAVQYQMAEQEMASILFFSTVFSVITMGGFIWLTA
jgi:malonate transporter and related proteins